MPELFVDIVARFAQFQKGLNTIQKDVEGFKAKLEHAGSKFEGAFKFAEKAAAIAGIGLGIHEFTEEILQSIEAMDQLGKAAQRTGIAVDELSALKFIASLEEIDFDTLIHGIEKFNRAIDEGSGAFHRLGLDPEELKDPQEALEAVAEKFSQLKDGSAKTALAIALFGRAGAQLIPILNKGKEGFEELRESAEKLGLIRTPDQIQQAQKFEEAMHKIAGAGRGLKESIANFLLPSLTAVAEAFVEGAEKGGIFLGVLESLAVASKVIFFGRAKSPIQDQKQEIEDATRELQRLLDLRERVDKGAHIRPEALAQLDKNIREKQVALASLVTGLNNLERPKNDKPDPKAKFQPDELSAVRLQNAIEAAKQEAEQAQQIEDIAFARGESSIAEHFKRRLDITKHGFDLELAATRHAIAEAKQELEDADEENQRKPIRARIEKLQGKEALLQAARKFAPDISDKQQQQAQEAFNDSIEDQNIELLKQTGRLHDAAEAQSTLNSARVRGNKLAQEPGGEDSEGFKNFKRLQQLSLAHADLAENLIDQATETSNLTSKEEEANTAYIEAGRGLDAYATMLDAINKAKRESVAETLRLVKAEEDLVFATTEAGTPEREAGLARVHAKRAAAGRTVAETSPKETASLVFSEADKKTQIEFEKVALKEEEIQNRRIAGEITEQQAVLETDRVRQQSIDTLREMLKVEQDLALQSGKDEDLIRATQTALALQRLEKSANETSKQMQNVFEDGLIDPLAEFIEGTKTAGDAFADFARNVARSISQIAAKNLAQAIFGTFGGNMTEGSSTPGGVSGFSAILGGILSSIAGSVAGGGLSGASRTAGGAATVPGGYDIPQNYTAGGLPVGTNYKYFADGGIMTPLGPLPLKRYAYGGIANSPQLAMFGEGRKPEAYVPLPDGRSIPVTMQGVHPAGAVTSNVVMNISTPDAQSFRRSQGQITTEIALAARRSLARR